MNKPLNEIEKEEMLNQAERAYDVINAVASDLRRRYPAKLPVVKVAMKASRQLFELKRVLLDIDLEHTPTKRTLPPITRGGKVVDIEDL